MRIISRADAPLQNDVVVTSDDVILETDNTASIDNVTVLRPVVHRVCAQGSYDIFIWCLYVVAALQTTAMLFFTIRRRLERKTRCKSA